jgi:hypothetical protein
MRERFGVVVGLASWGQSVNPWGWGTKQPGCLFVPSGFREGDRGRERHGRPGQINGSVGARIYLVRTSSGSQDRR